MKNLILILSLFILNTCNFKTVEKITDELTSNESREMAIDYCRNVYRRELSGSNGQIVPGSYDKYDVMAYEWDQKSTYIVNCIPVKKNLCKYIEPPKGSSWKKKVQIEQTCIVPSGYKWNGDYVNRSVPHLSKK